MKHETAATVPPADAGSGRPADISISALVLTEDEAARMLRLSARTLQRLRLSGDGPRFCQLTGRRIAYAVADLNEWLRARTVASSSESTVIRKAG